RDLPAARGRSLDLQAARGRAGVKEINGARDDFPPGGKSSLAPFISRRVLRTKPSATKEMTRLGNELARAGRSIISLSTGEPDFDTPKHVRDAGKLAIDSGKTRYTEVPGTSELEEANC